MDTPFALTLSSKQMGFLSLFKEGQTLTREQICDRIPFLTHQNTFGYFARALEEKRVVTCQRPEGGGKGSKIESLSLTALGGEQIGVKVKPSKVSRHSHEDIPCGIKTRVCYHHSKCHLAVNCLAAHASGLQ